MTRARDIANLVDANGDIVAGALDNVPASDVVNDTTPQLGGDLQSNGNDVTFGTNDAAVFGSSTNLRIYNDGSNSIIEEGSGTGDLFLRGTNNVYMQVSTDGATWENAILCDADGAVRLRYNNSNKLETTGTGVDVTGTVTADGATIDGARVLVQRANDDSTIVFANNASGTPSSHTWAAGLDYSNSNAFTVAYANTGVPSLTSQPKLVVDTSGNLTVTGNISAGGGLGKVLQVVANYDSSTYSLSSSGYFGPSVTITPSSTSSKLLILAMYSAGNSNNNGGVKIVQNGSVFMPNLSNAYQGGSSSYNGAFNTGDDSWGAASAYMIRPVHVQYLHSPNSTSALTYRGYWHMGSSGSLYLNRQEVDNGGRAFSHMTVMEIAG
jgi:hypothetical protein